MEFPGITTTSKEDAEKLAEDRLYPWVQSLVNKIEGKILTDYIPGKTITVQVNVDERNVVSDVVAAYTSLGWQVKYSGPTHQKTTSTLDLN